MTTKKTESQDYLTETQIDKFKDWEWDPIKYFKKGNLAKFTNLKNERGELVNDRMRPDTCADYFGKSPMGKKRLHRPAKTGGLRTYI